MEQLVPPMWQVVCLIVLLNAIVLFPFALCWNAPSPQPFVFWRVTWADGITRDMLARSEAEARTRSEFLMQHEFFDHGDILCIFRAPIAKPVAA